MKVVAIILLFSLKGCVFTSIDDKKESVIEVFGSELIINDEPLGIHEEKYNLRLLFRNNSKDTIGLILSNFKLQFTIPNTPIKIPCTPNENEIGFSIEKDDIKSLLYARRASKLILYPNSETNLHFIFFSPSISDFDEEQMKEISSKGIIRYQSPCESIVKGYFSPNVKWVKEIIIR